MTGDRGLAVFGAGPETAQIDGTATHRLWDEQRRVSLVVAQVREGAEGQLILRYERKRENHAAFDPNEDTAIENLLTAFVAWLEAPDGRLTQVVRLTQPKGALMRDVGRWAVEYAPVL